MENLGRDHIDIIEIGSSFWDTVWMQKQLTAHGSDGFKVTLPPSVLKQWAGRVSKTLLSVASIKGLKSTSTILWRTAHTPQDSQNHYIPQDQVTQIDHVARQVISDLVEPTTSPAWFINQAERTRSILKSQELGMKNRLKLDHSGTVMRGMNKHLKDSIHPAPTPNGKIWADM